MLNRGHIVALMEIRRRGLRSERIQPQVFNFCGQSANDAVRDCRSFRFTSSWLKELKPSNFMSRSSGGRLEIGIRRKRYSKDWVKAILFLTSGPVTVSRGAAASMPTKCRRASAAGEADFVRKGEKR
jgi:hypothetical protein